MEEDVRHDTETYLLIASTANILASKPLQQKSRSLKNRSKRKGLFGAIPVSTAPRSCESSSLLSGRDTEAALDDLRKDPLRVYNVVWEYSRGGGIEFQHHVVYTETGGRGSINILWE